MSKKINLSQQLSKKLQQLMDGQAQADDLLAELLQLGARKVLQEGLEAEVDEFLGRGWYERSEGDKESNGYRNGYLPKKFKTPSGAINVQKPWVRGNEESFESKLLERLDGLSESLKTLAVEMYTRGLSTRDIEAPLTDQQARPLVSRSQRPPG
jgi:transposase-like protein